MQYGRYDSEGYREFTFSDGSSWWVRRLSDGKEAYRTSNASHTTKDSLWAARASLVYEDKHEETR